jgi:hypothetical protein
MNDIEIIEMQDSILINYSTIPIKKSKISSIYYTEFDQQIMNEISKSFKEECFIEETNSEKKFVEEMQLEKPFLEEMHFVDESQVILDESQVTLDESQVILEEMQPTFETQLNEETHLNRYVVIFEIINYFVPLSVVIYIISEEFVPCFIISI